VFSGVPLFADALESWRTSSEYAAIVAEVPEQLFSGVVSVRPGILDVGEVTLAELLIDRPTVERPARSGPMIARMIAERLNGSAVKLVYQVYQNDENVLTLDFTFESSQGGAVAFLSEVSVANHQTGRFQEFSDFESKLQILGVALGFYREEE